MSLGIEVGLGSGDTVLEGTELPLPKGAQSPIFSHVYCGQTAGYISISLGTEEGLGQGDIVLDGAQLLSQRGRPPIFGPCLLWPTVVHLSYCCAVVLSFVCYFIKLIYMD